MLLRLLCLNGPAPGVGGSVCSATFLNVMTQFNSSPANTHCSLKRTNTCTSEGIPGVYVGTRVRDVCHLDVLLAACQLLVEMSLFDHQRRAISGEEVLGR